MSEEPEAPEFICAGCGYRHSGEPAFVEIERSGTKLMGRFCSRCGPNRLYQILEKKLETRRLAGRGGPTLSLKEAEGILAALDRISPLDDARIRAENAARREERFHTSTKADLSSVRRQLSTLESHFAGFKTYGEHETVVGVLGAGGDQRFELAVVPRMEPQYAVFRIEDYTWRDMRIDQKMEMLMMMLRGAAGEVLAKLHNSERRF